MAGFLPVNMIEPMTATGKTKLLDQVRTFMSMRRYDPPRVTAAFSIVDLLGEAYV
jgi:hypothetical protein